MTNRNILLLLPVDSKIASLDRTMMGYHKNEANVLYSLCLLLPTLTSLRNMLYGNISTDFNLSIDVNNIPGIIIRELFRSNIRTSLWNVLYFVDTNQFVDVLNDFEKDAVNGSLVHQQMECVFDKHQQIVNLDPNRLQSFFCPQLYHKKVIKVIDHLLFNDFYIDVWIKIIMQLINRYKQMMIQNIYKRNDSLHPMTESLVQYLHMTDNFDNALRIRSMLQVIDIYTIMKQKMINPNVPKNVHVFIEDNVIEFIHKMHGSDGPKNESIYSLFYQMIVALSDMIFESQST